MVEIRPAVNLEHRDSIWYIFVVAVLVYFPAFVNVPFHRIIQRKMQDLKNRIHQREIIVKQIDRLCDFLLSTDHVNLRRSISQNEFSRRKAFTIRHSHLSFSFLFILSILPLTLTSSTNSPIFFLDELTFNSSSTFFTHRSKMTTRWNVACCKKQGRAAFVYCNQTLFVNETDLNFFDQSKLERYAFLNDPTLFCKRHDLFQSLSEYLATFTYIIVTIGIILNIFVFLVLICGSLRRSTSFVLFLALTVFDLLSLASSMFAQLFRTKIPSLKRSPVFCKMFAIFFLYFRQCSSMTLLLIAVERCIVIKYPFCRDTFDRFRIPLLIFIMFMFITPIPFDFAFYTSGTMHCEAFDTVQADRYQIFRGFFTVLSYAIVPFIGISISNLLIIIELKKSNKRFTVKDKNGTKTRFSTK